MQPPYLRGMAQRRIWTDGVQRVDRQIAKRPARRRENEPANLVGPLAGQPLSAMVEALNSGNAYVNVHTNDGVPPAGTGPGDLPGGEIRGNF